MDDFSITNEGSIIGNNILTSNNELKIINNGAGEVNGNLTVNAPITTLEQKSSGDFLANIYGNSSTNILNLTNSTLFGGSLNGDMGTVNLTNDNTTSTSTMSLTNNGNIHNNINVNNDGTILAGLSDVTSPTVDTAFL